MFCADSGWEPTFNVQAHAVVSDDQWTEARKALLRKEKKFTRQRDQLSQDRRDLPWEPVDKDYIFDRPPENSRFLTNTQRLKNVLDSTHRLSLLNWLPLGGRAISIKELATSRISAQLAVRQRSVTMLV